MINIERTNYGFASIQASAEEWSGVKAMVKHAETMFSQTELLYQLSGQEEDRRPRLQGLIERLNVMEELPIELPKDDVHAVLCAVKAMEDFDVPGLDATQQNELLDQVAEYHVTDIFNDDLASDQQLAL